MPDGYSFDADSVGRIRESVRFTEGMAPSSRARRQVLYPPGGTVAKWYWGKLSTALGGGHMSTPATCEVNVWVPDPDSVTDPVGYIVTDDPELLGVTVVNRDPTAIAAVGTVCKIHKGGGEDNQYWSLLWLGCSE